jgi:integrase
MWWDASTLGDIASWAAKRIRDGALADDPFICSSQANRLGAPLQRHALRRRFRTACKALGVQRLYGLTIHHGRHTFISHALAGGRTLAEVRDAAGHSNVSITSAYLHVAVDEDGALGNLFKFD